MSKYFQFSDEYILGKATMAELQFIRDTISEYGLLRCTDMELFELWERFSDTYDAQWLNPNSELIHDFADWLDRFEGEVF